MDRTTLTGLGANTEHRGGTTQVDNPAPIQDTRDLNHTPAADRRRQPRARRHRGPAAAAAARGARRVSDKPVDGRRATRVGRRGGCRGRRGRLGRGSRHCRRRRRPAGKIATALLGDGARLVGAVAGRPRGQARGRRHRGLGEGRAKGRRGVPAVGAQVRGARVGVWVGAGPHAGDREEGPGQKGQQQAAHVDRVYAMVAVNENIGMFVLGELNKEVQVIF